MDWLTRLRNSPWTKVVLAVLTLVLGGVGIMEGTNVARGAVPPTAWNIQAPAMWIGGAVLTLLGTVLTGPFGQKQITAAITRGFSYLRAMGPANPNVRVGLGLAIADAALEFSNIPSADPRMRAAAQQFRDLVLEERKVVTTDKLPNVLSPEVDAWLSAKLDALLAAKLGEKQPVVIPPKP